MRLSLVLVFLAAGAFLVPGTASAQTKLTATVGPAFSIQLSNESGGRVTQLDPGTYEITVTDRSVEHNFHLTGPGVNEMTEVDFEGTVTWTVTFTDGVYRFVCDPHSTTMRGQFRVGTPPVTTPPPAPKRLTGTVGPGFSISMRTPAGAVARTATAGTYRITIRDRSAAHNFHLIGPGVNRRTSVAFRGTVTWTLRLRAGTYRFLCDPHARQMRGSFRAR